MGISLHALAVGNASREENPNIIKFTAPANCIYTVRHTVVPWREYWKALPFSTTRKALT